MMASHSGNEFHTASGAPYSSRALSLPPTLKIRSVRMLLKTPTPQDDLAMCEIFSHPITVEYLPHFYRSGGWTREEMALRREKLLSEQLQGKGLTLFIHLLPGHKHGNENSPMEENDIDEEDMVLIGTTGFRTIDFHNGTAEIGIILHHPYWRKGLATEAMYLCLRYAFETLGLERVDWYTSAENRYMRAWCEDLLHLKPFPANLENLEDWVGYSIQQSEWNSRAKQFLEQKVFPGKALHG